MDKGLIQKLKRERIAGVKVSILLAMIVSAGVLAASFVAFQLLDESPGQNIDDVPDNEEKDFVLSLSSYMEEQYIEGNIAALRIGGNATQSIHPDLISSLLVPTNGGFEVEAQ